MQNVVIGDTMEKSALISAMEDPQLHWRICGGRVWPWPMPRSTCLLPASIVKLVQISLMEAEEEKMRLAKVDLPACF